MREIKFLSHLTRNIYLYFGLYFALIFLSTTHYEPKHLFLGLVTFFIGYAPVYFVNDFVDRDEDVKYNKSNLYASIKNLPSYWLLVIIATIIGTTCSYYIDPYAAVLVSLISHVFL